jgi:tetratricopeptide (TPR) repeat protein
MKRFQLLLLTAFALVTAFPCVAQQVKPYGDMPGIQIGNEKLEVKPDVTERWRKRASVSPKTPRGNEPSKTRVQELAKEFGLLNKTAMNPNLAFTNDDIDYWYNRKLDESDLALQFSARRLILEQADEQRIAIADRKVLDQAAQQVIPLLQKPAQDPISSTIACAGDTSQELVKQSWAALLDKDYDKALACTDRAIKKWSRQADTQQLKAATGDCDETPKPEDQKPYFTANWALSDIATSWFIRGEVFYQQAKWKQAREAYKNVLDKYHCAFTLSREGWFWRTADGAQEKYDEIRLR